MSKKSQVDPFQIGERLGYYVLTIIMLTILFFFFAVLARGIENKYYKSDYGVNAMNVEERFFDCVSYEDAITGLEYSRVIVMNKVEDEIYLSNCMGIVENANYNGIKAEIYDLNNNLLATGKTNNYVDRPDLEKIYPVTIYIDDFEVGYIKISLWKV